MQLRSIYMRMILTKHANAVCICLRDPRCPPVEIAFLKPVIRSDQAHSGCMKMLRFVVFVVVNKEPVSIID